VAQIIQTHEEIAEQLRVLTTGLRAVLDVLATHIEGDARGHRRGHSDRLTSSCPTLQWA
jgi:hypothetical protein